MVKFTIFNKDAYTAQATTLFKKNLTRGHISACFKGQRNGFPSGAVQINLGCISNCWRHRAIKSKNRTIWPFGWPIADPDINRCCVSASVTVRDCVSKAICALIASIRRVKKRVIISIQCHHAMCTLRGTYDIKGITIRITVVIKRRDKVCNINCRFNCIIDRIGIAVSANPILCVIRV